MRNTEVMVAGGTVAQTFDRVKDAEAAAARLRTAGFSDVRLSERSGTTSETHVPVEAGTTETDFATLLERAGFAPVQARAMTAQVVGGATLLTLATGGRIDAAIAVLNGETVAAAPLSAVDLRPNAAPAEVPVAPGRSGSTASTAPVPYTGEAAYAGHAGYTGEAAYPGHADDAGDAAYTGAAADGSPTRVASEPDSTVEPGDRVIPLRAERLDISKERSTSEARIRKETVTEERTITVPVRREQLVVERDGEETVRIPLSEQT